MPDKALDRLAATIRTAGNQREMTQETLSDLSGVSVRHIGKIENGEINPSFEVLLSLVTALKISFDTLFYQDEAQEQKNINELGTLYRACPEQGRRVMLSAARAIAKEYDAATSSDHSDHNRENTGNS